MSRFIMKFATYYVIPCSIVEIQLKKIQGGPSKTSHQGAPRKPPYWGLPAQ